MTLSEAYERMLGRSLASAALANAPTVQSRPPMLPQTILPKEILVGVTKLEPDKIEGEVKRIVAEAKTVRSNPHTYDWNLGAISPFQQLGISAAQAQMGSSAPGSILAWGGSSGGFIPGSA